MITQNLEAITMSLVGEWIAQTMGYYLELIRNELSINERACKKFKYILLSKKEASL